jgi:hypothetical protein
MENLHPVRDEADLFADFQDVSHPDANKLDRTVSSRMGWSDVALSLAGPVVQDLRTHSLRDGISFTMRNTAKRRPDTQGFQRPAVGLSRLDLTLPRNNANLKARMKVNAGSVVVRKASEGYSVVAAACDRRCTTASTKKSTSTDMGVTTVRSNRMLSMVPRGAASTAKLPAVPQNGVTTSPLR